jgi:hypothetical protein
MTTILGLASGVILVAFVFFAFRQGFKVKPSDNPPPPSIGD